MRQIQAGGRGGGVVRSQTEQAAQGSGEGDVAEEHPKEMVVRFGIKIKIKTKSPVKLRAARPAAGCFCDACRVRVRARVCLPLPLLKCASFVWLFVFLLI